ncbi:uncharacterized protein LOC111070654 [Drosophila obscura]|uniref:uncharacterized protein LOC111070654 n=1 Tax=Drosophila obscura TaxID=7282 RepID=UPI001BB2726D|nr:uncharacterized protein LOC111070654 [Drosophila obscura]
MESESMGEAQQHMEQTMDAPFEYIYASTTSLEPYDMTRDSCNQSLGGSQRPLEDTLSKGIQYFDPRLASPSSNDSSCNMESRTLNYYMDRPQSMGGYRDQLKEDAMAERITVPDSSLSLPSSHEGPANMENRDFNQSMGGDQQPMEDAMDGSGEASSSRECLSLNESIEEFLHCMQRKMDEIGKHPDQSDAYPTSTTSMEPCEMTRRSISQSIDGDQQPTEIIPFLNPSSLDVDPCDMEYHVFDQPAGGEECLLEYNRNEGNQILEPALSSSLSDEDTFKVEYRDIHQSMGRDQHPMENTTDENITYFDASLSSRSPHKGSSNMDSRTLKHFMDRAQHHLEQGTSLPPTSSRLEPSGMRCHFMDQSMGGYRDQLEEDAMAERIAIPDSSLSLPSSHEGPANMENRDFNQSMGGDQQPMEDAMDGSGEASSSRECLSLNESIEEFLHCMQRKMDEIGKHPDQSDAYPTSTTSMEPCEMTRRSISQSIDGDQQPTEVIPFLNPSSLDVDPCDMEYHVFDQPAGGEECLLEDNMNEGIQICEPALSSSLSDEDTFKVEYRDFNQSMGGDQQPMEDAMDGSAEVSYHMEYRAFNQFLDESLHHMEQTMDEPGKHLHQSDAYPMSTTSMEPCEVTRRSISQSIDGDQQPTEVIPFLNPSSLDVDPCDMEYHVFDQPVGGEECLLEDNMNEGIQICEPALSSSLSDEDTCKVEYRDFYQSMGGDQHPMDTMEELSDTELPSFRQYISRGVYLPDTTMGGGPPQFKKTTKDASQFDDLVHPAGIERPMVSSQNVMQETLLGIQKIFKSANGATKSSLGCHPVGQSGMGKISFNQSTGGPQQLMQLMLGGAVQGDEKTNRAPQKLQKSLLEPQADMDMYPWVSMRRGISKSMSCPQIVILSTLEEPPKCHVNTKLEAQKLEKGSGPGTGPEPGKMEQHSLPVERPKLLRHKTMDVTQQGDKNSKADAPTFKCPGPSGMGSYLWDSMGRALGKSVSGLQMLMQNARDESLNGYEKIESGFQKLNAVINGDFVTSDIRP